MRTVIAVIGVLCLIGGIGLIAAGFFYPDGFRLANASAPQIAQVYSEGAFRLAQGIALMTIAIGCGVLTALMDAQDRIAREHAAAQERAAPVTGETTV